MLNENSCKNKIINQMFKEIKSKYVLKIYQKVKENNNVVIEQDEERVFQFKSGVLEYEQFKLNLSIPSDPTDRNNCLGTYINIEIPQYENIGVLFIPQENGMFKYSPTWDYKIKYFNSIDININYTYESCIKLVQKIIFLFEKAFLLRYKLIADIIKLKYPIIKEDIEFKKIKINFIPPITNNKNFYSFYYNEDLEIVFLNDIFKTNYKSVINGIEEIATQIVKTNSNIDPINTKWINIFININNDGIILQKMKLEKKFNIEKANIFLKIIFRKTDKQEFIAYDRVHFSTEYYITKEEVINIWNNILDNK